MATSAGPNLEGVKNNDLSFSFDAYDAKSYPGEPTTNIIPRSNALTNTNIYNVVSGTLADDQIDGPNGRKAGSITASNSDPYIYSSYVFTVETGSLTFSAYVKGSGATIGMGGDIRINFGTSAGQATGSNTTSNYTITGDWQRVSVTATVTGAGTIKVGLESPNSATAGQVVYIADPQLEQKGKATPYVVGPNCNDDGTYNGRPETVSLLVQGNVGTGQSFTDSSAYGHTITANGNVTHSLDRSKFDGGSFYFDGSGDYLAIPDDAAFDFGTLPFTVDVWANFTKLDTDGWQTIYGGDYSQGLAIYLRRTGGTHYIYIYLGPSAGVGNAVWSTPQLNTWYHLATTRDKDGVIRFYIDGVQLFTFTNAGSIVPASAPFIGGQSRSGPGNYYYGYMDEFRLVKGKALWEGSASFVPPTRRGAGGPIIDRSSNNNAGMLLNGAGVEATGPTTRRDGQVILPVTDAYIDFDGTDEYASIPDSSLWDATGGISVSGWCYADSLGSYNVIVNQWSTAANSSSSWTLETVGSDWRFYMYDSGAATLKYASSTGTATTGAWKHIVGVFNGTTLKVYVNGVEGGTTATVTTANTSSFPLRLGQFYDTTTGNWDGQIASTQIYNKALTAAQVKQNFNQQRSRFGI
jgi:hypothetical protein